MIVRAHGLLVANTDNHLKSVSKAPLQINDAEPGGVRYRIGAAGGIELVDDTPNVKFRGVERDAKFAGGSDLLRGQAQADSHEQCAHTALQPFGDRGTLAQ